MTALPIRVRLTAVFAAAMAVVLALVFLFLYLSLRASLDTTIDNGLRSRSDDVSALVSQADSGLAQGGASTRLAKAGESFAQVLTHGGKVFDSTPGASRPALRVDRLARLSAPAFIDAPQVSGIEGAARLLATPVVAQGKHLVIVVGASTGERDDALSGLLGAFAIGGPLAVLLSSGLGYLLAAAGLGPVEALRRRAEGITLRRDGERLPLPKADDELRRLGVTLNAMLARLEDSLARERSFVADASHELRTPLAVLKAELEVTLRGEGYDEATGAALRSAADEVDQLIRLTEDMLVIARAEAGELDVRREPTDLLEVLRPLVDSRDGVELVVSPGLEASIDSTRIRQAIGNLVDNAIRHGAPPVVVEAMTDRNALNLSVTDSGRGFPPGFAALAFERYSRADGARSRDGSGLGLAIVQAIARAHEGEASIESHDGALRRVSIRLPLSFPRH